MPFVADDVLYATAAHIDEMRLFGYRPQTDEEDPRPSPTDERIAGAAADIFDALVVTFLDTSSEPDLEALLWSEVSLFHRAIVRVDALLDANELAQKTSQSEQDGSELRSVELERLLVAGAALIERRNVLEQFRDIACDLYARHLGAQWRPRSGSLTHQRRLTASMIDSRDYLAARRTATLTPLLPPGPRIAFTGGGDCNDHRTIWDCLDRAHARHVDMVLIHGGALKGAEAIAACWARTRGVAQIVFKPDWTRHAKAAPFKRNDVLLAELPVGLIAFPGSGVSANLVDKARKLGIPIWKCGGA
jgi:hypothetical protein